MQPLISPVDHESRRDAHNAEDVEAVTEETPLLRAPSDVRALRELTTVVSVGVLILVLVIGVVIGIYLLVLQNEAENILPPSLGSVQIVRLANWDGRSLGRTMGSYRAERVIIEETNTTQCHEIQSCITLLRNMKNCTRNPMTYNFLVSSNGIVFEALGWGRQSPMYTKGKPLVLALIGNYTNHSPTSAQVESTSNFILYSELESYLEYNSVILIKNNTFYRPLYDKLFRIASIIN